MDIAKQQAEPGEMAAALPSDTTAKTPERQTVSDTSETNRMVGDPQISVASLKRDIELMRFAGFWPDKVECGPLVFELLTELVICGNRESPSEYWTEDRILVREERMRQNMLMGLTDMTFNGMPVFCHDDVPDGRLWPPRDKGGMVVKPFPGTEAYLAI